MSERRGPAAATHRRLPGNAVIRRARIPTEVLRPQRRRRLSVSPRPWMVALLFALVMLIGGALLSLPIASETREGIPFLDALFTAVSAMSVTGLTRFDTADAFSGFGELITLVLFQLGGLGVTMYAGILILAAGRRLGMRSRQFFGMELHAGGGHVAGAPGLLRRVMIYTATVELATFILLLPWYLIEIGGARSAWTAFYHAISAFNNAGFDLMGGGSGFVAQAGAGYPLIVMSISALLGSLSFLTVFDLPRGRRRWSLDTRVVLAGMGGLLLIGMAFFLALEWSGLLAERGPGGKLANAFFLSVNRTTGMATVDMAELQAPISGAMLVLMFIGGASTSTASGIKVGAFVVSVLAVFAALRGRRTVSGFGREVPQSTVVRAFAVVMLGLTAYAVGAIALLAVESGHGPVAVAFDAMSALANVGWSQGVSAAASQTGANIMIVLMFAGRLGPMIVALAIPERPHDRYRLPAGDVRIG